MPSPYQSAVNYSETVTAVFVKKFIEAGLGDSLFGAMILKVSPSTLTQLLTDAFISGQLDAIERK